MVSGNVPGSRNLSHLRVLSLELWESIFSSYEAPALADQGTFSFDLDHGLAPVHSHMSLCSRRWVSSWLLSR